MMRFCCPFAPTLLLRRRSTGSRREFRECNGHQTNVSTLEGQARTHARFFGAHEVARRPCRDRRTPRQGSAAPRGLTQRSGFAIGRVAACAVPPLAHCPKVAAVDKHEGFEPGRRLKTPAEYSALLRASRGQSIRAVRQYLSVAAAWTTSGETSRDAATVRFGVTVGKRYARRAVDRALLKRIVREACRHHASSFELCAAQADVCIDVALRLQSPLINVQGEALAMRRWRRQVRVEADALLQHLLDDLPVRLRAWAGEVK